LGTSFFTDAIESILDADDAGIQVVPQIVENVRSAIDANQLRGESGRALEAYPDHAGLRLLRGVSEAMATNPEESTITDNIKSSIEFGTTRYGIESNIIYQAILASAQTVSDSRLHLGQVMVSSLLDASEDRRALARVIVKNVPPKLSLVAQKVLILEMNKRTRMLLEA
jgi:hypothetical protein